MLSPLRCAGCKGHVRLASTCTTPIYGHLSTWTWLAPQVELCMQIVGTFQSYHQAPTQAVFDLLNSPPYQANFVNKSENIPNRYAFSHLTITQQLEAGAWPSHRACSMHVLECIFKCLLPATLIGSCGF